MIYLGKDPVGMNQIGELRRIAKTDWMKTLTLQPGYVNGSNGNVTSPNSTNKEVISDFGEYLETNSNISIITKLNNTSGLASPWIGIGFYEEDGTYITRWIPTSITNSAVQIGNFKYNYFQSTTPANVGAKQRISFRTFGDDAEILVIDTSDFWRSIMEEVTNNG